MAYAALNTTEVFDDIISATEEKSIVLSRFNKRQMSTTVAEQVVSGSDTAFAPSATTPLVKKTADFGKATLTVADLAAVIGIPDATLEDTDFDLASHLRERFSSAFAKSIDTMVLAGTGAPASWSDAGLCAANSAAASTFTKEHAGADATYIDDFNELLGALEADYEPDLFILPTTMKATLRGLKDSQGRPVFLEGFRNDKSVASVFGIDTEFTTVLTSTCRGIALDTTHHRVGLRKDLTIKKLRELFALELETGIRGVMRMAYAQTRPAGNKSPYAVLLDAVAG